MRKEFARSREYRYKLERKFEPRKKNLINSKSQQKDFFSSKNNFL